jgi:hypothetical protein
MNTLNMPGFTAESSLWNTGRHFTGVSRALLGSNRATARVMPSLRTLSRSVAPGEGKLKEVEVECDLICYLQCRYLGTGSDAFCTNQCCG